MLLRSGAFVLSLLGLLTGVAAADQTVRIAHQKDFPPFTYVKDGKSVGLVIDLLDAAARREGVKIVFVPVAFADVDATLTNGQADAITPLAITPDRKKTYDFTAPVVQTGGSLFVKAPQATPSGLAALAGKSLATPKTGPFVAYLQKNAPHVKLVITADYPSSFSAVINGTADAAALNFQVGGTMVAQSYAGKVTIPTTMFTQLPEAVAVTKGTHAKLLDALDAGLTAIRNDGTWQKIDDKWTPH